MTLKFHKHKDVFFSLCLILCSCCFSLSTTFSHKPWSKTKVMILSYWKTTLKISRTSGRTSCIFSQTNQGYLFSFSLRKNFQLSFINIFKHHYGIVQVKSVINRQPIQTNKRKDENTLVEAECAAFFSRQVEGKHWNLCQEMMNFKINCVFWAKKALSFLSTDGFM